VSVDELARFLVERLDDQEASTRAAATFRGLGDDRPHVSERDLTLALANLAGRRRAVANCVAAGGRLAETILRRMALLYADHPDYRPRWRFKP
jgi:hypothetical protein